MLSCAEELIGIIIPKRTDLSLAHPIIAKTHLFSYRDWLKVVAVLLSTEFCKVPEFALDGWLYF